jgi:hypothetical protein
MALTYVTGHDLALTIDSVSYDDVAASVTLAVEPNQQTLEVLSGRAYKTIDYTATLSVELYQDWGSTSPASVCEALFDADGQDVVKVNLGFEDLMVMAFAVLQRGNQTSKKFDDWANRIGIR